MYSNTTTRIISSMSRTKRPFRWRGGTARSLWRWACCLFWRGRFFSTNGAFCAAPLSPARCISRLTNTCTGACTCRRSDTWSVPGFRLNGHHLLHHRYMNKNFNVVLPLADLCLGTLLLRSKIAFAQAQRNRPCRTCSPDTIETARSLQGRRKIFFPHPAACKPHSEGLRRFALKSVQKMRCARRHPSFFICLLNIRALCLKSSNEFSKTRQKKPWSEKIRAVDVGGDVG